MLKTYLLYLNNIKTKKTSGFTLIELLVAVVIISILTAIALPSFLGQTAKAKQTQAKTTIGSINSTQLAFRNENSSFAKDMDTLGIGLPLETPEYSYKVSGDVNTSTVTAQPKDTALKGYSGGTVVFAGKTNNSAIASAICENEQPGNSVPTPPILQTGSNTPEEAAKCNEGQTKL